MIEKPWAENIVQITESYEEKYPSGKRNYEMINFGPVYESRFLYIPDDVDIDDYILKAREKMHDRLVKSVIDMCNKAIGDGRLIGVNKREVK